MTKNDSSSGDPRYIWDCFFTGKYLEKFSITSLSHQWILYSEWVPSEWEAKQLIKTSQQYTSDPHDSSPSINILWRQKLRVCKKLIYHLDTIITFGLWVHNNASASGKNPSTYFSPDSDKFLTNTQLFTSWEFIDGLDWSGLLVDYCDVFNGTHSLILKKITIIITLTHFKCTSINIGCFFSNRSLTNIESVIWFVISLLAWYVWWDKNRKECCIIPWKSAGEMRKEL